MIRTRKFALRYDPANSLLEQAPASWTGRRTNASPSTTNAFRRLSHSFHDWTPSPRSGVNLTLPNLGAIPQ